MSYLPLFYSQLYNFFESFLIDKGSVDQAEAWLDFEGVPLKWYAEYPYPLSILILFFLQLTRLASLPGTGP